MRADYIRILLKMNIYILLLQHVHQMEIVTSLFTAKYLHV